jgi:hypothetical protein
VSGERVRDTDCDVVEQTKAHRPFARCVMTRRSNRTERGAAFAAHHQVGAQHHRACRMSRRLERIGIERGIGIEIMNSRSRARRLHLVDVLSGVNALELLPRCRRRIVMRDHSVEPGADQVIVDRIETLRALRMVRTHVVQATRGMRDVCDGHGKW